MSSSAAPGPVETLRSAGTQLVLQAFPDGAIVLFDHELRFLAMGGHNLADVGLSVADLEGRTMFEVFPPETTAVIEPPYRRALAGLESTIEVTYAERVYLQRLAPVIDANGEIIAGISFAQDVTEAREVEHALAEERRRLADAQAIGGIASWEMDVATRNFTTSDSLLDLYGIDQFVPRSTFEALAALVHPDDEAALTESIVACATHGRAVRHRYRITRSNDGALRWFDLRGQAVHEGGRIERVVGAIIDVTEQVQAEANAITAHAFQRGLLAAVGQSLIATDPQGRVIAWNRAAESTYGWSEAEAMGRLVSDLVTSQESGGQAQEIMAALGRGETWTGNFPVRRRDGTVFPALVTDAPVFDEDGNVVAVIGVSTDMSDRVRLEQELTRQALYDTLTGLPNRALLIDRLTHALEAWRRHDQPVAVLLIDLDQFKNVNDASGHLAGDELLVEVARRLNGVARAEDTVARFGGDEFVLVCAHTDVAEAERIAARIAAALDDPITVGGQPTYVTASIGIAVTPPIAADANLLLQHANAAMSEAKAHGRARYRVFDESLQVRSSQRRKLTSELRVALSQDALEVHYQPVINLVSGQLIGLEALVRWLHPDDGLIPPDLFVPLAEESGLSAVLDRWVLARACRDIAALRSAQLLPLDATIAVNISAHTSTDPDLVDAVCTTASNVQLPLDALVLEITETATMSDPTAAQKVLTELRELGVGVALDDFGTGYSSLTFIRQLPVTVIKIDRTFIQGLTESADDQAIVAAVIALANALGLPTIAEGVETPEQLAELQRLGCTSAQGYLWSQALPLPDLEQMLHERHARFVNSAGPLQHT